MYGSAHLRVELCRGSRKKPIMSTVLIVEDDFAILFVAECSQRLEGYETVAVPTRKDALAILRSDREVDVLFTDINLCGEKRAGLDLAIWQKRPRRKAQYETGPHSWFASVRPFSYFRFPIFAPTIPRCRRPCGVPCGISSR
jgi:hypothetical protein